MRPVTASETLGAQPAIDALYHRFPVRFEHHVVAYTREDFGTTSASGVSAEKKYRRERSGVLNPCNDRVVTAVLSETQGCRFISRAKKPRAPLGGAEASSTPAGASWDSRYFWTTTPPRECPITTGRAGRSSATVQTSVTKSAIRQNCMRLTAGLLPAMAANAQGQCTIALVGEEPKEMFVPTPCAVAMRHGRTRAAPGAPH